MTAPDPGRHAAPADPAGDLPPVADAFTDVPDAAGRAPAAGEVDADDMFAPGGE